MRARAPDTRPIESLSQVFGGARKSAETGKYPAAAIVDTEILFSPKLRATPRRKQRNFIFPLVFADSFRQNRFAGLFGISFGAYTPRTRVSVRSECVNESRRREVSGRSLMSKRGRQKSGKCS